MGVETLGMNCRWYDEIGDANMCRFIILTSLYEIIEWFRGLIYVHICHDLGVVTMWWTLNFNVEIVYDWCYDTSLDSVYEC